MFSDDDIPSDEPRVFAGERFLPGPFLKYNSNNGYVSEGCYRHHEVVQAFLHFTFVSSEFKLLVTDLQGVARDGEVLLTDPQVLSLEGSYGPGDLQTKGFHACLAAHRCGPTCRLLGLKPISVAALRRFKIPSATSAMSSASAEVLGSACSSLTAGWENVSDESGISAGWERLSEVGVEKSWDMLSEVA